MLARQSFPLSDVYGLLEPGPVLLLSTARAGRNNIMTLSWHTMIEFEPPLVGCVLSNRDYSFDILRDTGECVLNIPTVELAEQVVGCGNTSGEGVDKFAAFDLTPVDAERVKAPLVDECYASLECRVVDDRLVDQYGLFIVEVVKAWINPLITNPRTIHHRGKGAFMVAGETIRLPSRMK